MVGLLNGKVLVIGWMNYLGFSKKLSEKFPFATTAVHVY